MGRGTSLIGQVMASPPWSLDGVGFAALAASAALGAWAASVSEGPVLAASLALAGILGVLAAIDARHFLLPDCLTLPLAALGLAVIALLDPALLPDHGAAALAGYGAFAGVAWLYRRVRGEEGLGLGDAKLLAAGGAWTGLEGLASIVLIAAIAGLALAGVLRLLGRTIGPQTKLPFGVFLALGIEATWLHGPLRLGP